MVDYFQYTCTESCNSNEEPKNGWCKCKDNKLFDYESSSCDGDACKADDEAKGLYYYFDQASRICYPNGCLKMQNYFMIKFNFKFSTGTLLNPGPGRKGECTSTCEGYQKREYEGLCICNVGFVLHSEESICISEENCWKMGKKRLIKSKSFIYPSFFLQRLFY